jgi:hypothetical protein
MASLPNPLLASYWIPAVGIGDPLQWVRVPLTDVLNYTLANGSSQTSIVFLGFGNFSCTPDNFQPPYITIGDEVLQQLTLQPGQTQTAVQQLQAAGVKVLLSVAGSSALSMGWDTIPYGQGTQKYANMIAFAQWVQTNLIEAYGLDGIDIDDEWAPTNPQTFMDTVGTLRQFMGGSLLSKALWADDAHFQTAVSSDAPYNAGAMLSSLLDLGGTMAYGYPFQSQVQAINTYKGYGMTWNQLCVGVQAGTGSWMTPIEEVSQLAQWAVTSQSGSPPVLGMMLYTFSQDIQQWTHVPQNSPGYMYPNPNDHEWQKAIVEGMWGPGNWNVSGS